LAWHLENKGVKKMDIYKQFWTEIDRILGQFIKEHNTRLATVQMEALKAVVGKCQLPQWVAKTSSRESDSCEWVTQVGEKVFLDFRGNFWKVNDLTLPLDLTTASMVHCFTPEELGAIAEFIQNHNGDKTLHMP